MLEKALRLSEIGRVSSGNRPKLCACRPGEEARFVRHGFFYRRSDSRKVRRFRCLQCRRTRSLATSAACYRQKKRRANLRLYRLFCAGVSQRRAARISHLNRKTVVRKFRFLAEQCRVRHVCYQQSFVSSPLEQVVFDEMETFEHTKLKPVSIAVAVSAKREVLATEIAQMPAKGLLAAKSRKKYGPRFDDRPRALRKLLHQIKPITKQDALFKSDKNPHYPKALKRIFPNARHITTKGGRAAVVGQGELKKLAFDPLFSLNHTAAMLRANMNRLFRRTWCTTKTLAGLRDHIALYVAYHNEVLLKFPSTKPRKPPPPPSTAPS